MKFIFIADFFADEILGGGEINNEELAMSLRKKDHSVLEVKSSHTTAEYIADNADCCFVVSNFVHLTEDAKDALTRCRYIIYEHDHKYLRNRNPAVFPNFQAPESEIVNREFYRNALGVFCQSSFHAEIVRKNLHLDNIKNLSGNIWSDDTLNYLEELSKNPKGKGFSIMNSQIDHKNTIGAIRYCESQNYPYQLISSGNYHDFLKQLAENDKFVFLPQTPETLSRVAVEARMLGVEVHTNMRVGASYENWFELKGEKLIKYMRSRRAAIVDAVEQVFETGRCTTSVLNREYPKISILTSLFKGDLYINDFLYNMTRQSIFDRCELIIVDANSPGMEKRVIDRYLERFPNIIYKRLDHDPGIYGCWNIALEMASGEFVTNANLDDRRSLQQLEVFVNELMNNKDIDLVYSQCLVTHSPNEDFSSNSSQGKVYPVADFTPQNMIKCLPGCMPVWRKSLHEKFGFFNQEYKFAGDWEMWLRFVEGGAQFKRVSGVHGLYYHNPYGLTTDESKQKEKFEEEKIVFHKYSKIFGESNYAAYKEYFSQ